LVLAGDLLLNREQEGDLLSWLPVVGLLNERDYYSMYGPTLTEAK